MAESFTDHRMAARAVLATVIGGIGALRPKEGQFLGGLAFDANPLTDKQANWLAILLDKHGMPPLMGGGAK